MYTQAERQAIIEDFARDQPDGIWRPGPFYQHVMAAGNNHPAWAWFDGFDKDKAADAHWTERSREFGQGLKVKFTIETISREGTLRVRHTEGPLLISPVARRRDGGGYDVNPDKPDLVELSRQAIQAGYAWIDRYQAAVLNCGGSIAAIHKQIALLESFVSKSERDEAA